MAENTTNAGSYTIPAPRPEEDAASAYQELATKREENDLDQWMSEASADGGEDDPQGLQDPATFYDKVRGEAGLGPAAEGGDGGEDEGLTLGGVAKDLGHGIVEAPGQIWGGAVDALDEVGQAFGELTGIGGVQFFDEDEEGNLGAFNPKYLDFEEFQAAGGDDLLNAISTKPADSVTGGFVRATSQFLTGFIPALKGVKTIKALQGSKVLAPMAAGMVADAVVFDPHEDRLSTFLNEIPALEPYVSDYLADNNPENESSWEGRMKNAIEGIGMGLTAEAIGGLIKGFKYYKSQRSMKFAPDAAGAQAEAGRDAFKAAAREELVVDIPDEALAPLGNPNGPMLVQGGELDTAGTAFQRLAKADERAALSIERNDALAKISTARERLVETVKAAGGEGVDADPFDQLIDQLRSGGAVAKTADTGGKRPVSAIIKGMGGIDPASSLAAELKSNGVTSRTHPGLFRKGGHGALDNVPVGEQPIFEARGVDDGQGYVPEQSFIDALKDEAAGEPWLTTDQQRFIDDQIAPLADLDEQLGRLGIDVSEMSNARVKERLQEIADEEAMFTREMAPPEAEAAGADLAPADPTVAFHRTAERFEEIDFEKSADGNFWLAGSRDQFGGDVPIVTTGRGVDLEVEISPDAKLANWDEYDKFSSDELVNQGFDGAKLDDDGEIQYVFFNKDVLKILPEKPAAVEITPATVRDAAGEPLQLYHGSGTEFEKFDVSKGAQRFDESGGIFLTSRRGLAVEHALRGEKPTVTEFSARIDNPLEVTAKAGDPDTHWLQNADQITRDMNAGGHDGVVIRADDGEVMVIAMRDDQVSRVADASAPKPKVDPEAVARADAGVDGMGATPQGKIFINHARINSSDDVRAVLQEMADLDADAINAKRGGEVVTNEQTIAASSKEYQDMSDLLGREPGPMTASQSVAARKLLTSSGEQIVDLARRAAAADASKADIYNFRRSMAVHYAIQSEVIAARTETARALQAWAIPAGADKVRSQSITELIMNNGGSGDLQSLAKAVSTIGDNPTALNTMARELGKGRFGKALYQVWINGLLSSPKTHAVNIMSNAMVAVWAIPERYLASGISKAFYGGEITSGEVASQAYGLMKGVRDGARLVFHGNKAEDVSGLGDVFDAFGKTEIHGNAISADAFGLKPEGTLGHGIDMLGRLVNTPGSMLGVEDKFFKSIGYRMELNALAHRRAVSEGLEGKEFAERIADILNNPPAELRADALELANYQTFTNQLGETGQAFQKAIQKIPGARLVVPFIRTPTNIIKYTFERTPLAYMSGSIRADIKAGGARAAQAHARVAMGSMLMMIMGDMATEGTVTGRGPSDHRQRSLKMGTGWKPYSIKVGDRWYQYSRTDPIGMMMGLGADISEVLTNVNNEDSEMLATAGVLALANNLANKTYMTGLYDFIGAIDPSNQTNSPGKYITDFTGSMMPFSSFMRNVTNVNDPIIRDARVPTQDIKGVDDPVSSFFDTIINNQRKVIPGLSNDLPPRLDLWGEEISRESGLGIAWDFISPIASHVDKPDAVVQTMLDNKIGINRVPRAIQGVQLTPEEYSEFAREAGQPLKTYLDGLVSSKGFQAMSDGPDGMKAELIRDAVNNFRKRAKAIMIQGNPRLQELIYMRQLEKAQTLQGDQ